MASEEKKESTKDIPAECAAAAGEGVRGQSECASYLMVSDIYL